MKDYQKSKIYSIRSRTSDEIYIGSTTAGIAKRFSKHKSAYNYWVKDNSQKYYSSFILFEKYNIDDLYYELVEEYPCDNVEQLRKIEGKYIRKYMKDGVCCNKLIAGRSKKEYSDAFYIQNKEAIRERQRQYYIDNKEERDEHSKKYYNLNKDKVKKYHEKNKDKIGKYRKKRYSDNKTKTTCECGTIVGTQSINKHRESNKHHMLLNQK
jgi:hypothetical protein